MIRSISAVRNGQLHLTDVFVVKSQMFLIAVSEPLRSDSCAFNSSECSSNVSDITS